MAATGEVAPPGGYTISGSITLAAAPADVVAWLATPELLDRWMLGVDGIEVMDEGRPVLGARIRAVTSSGRHAGWIFSGEIVELSAQRVVRRYALDELSTGGVRLEADTSGYARTVTYDLTPAGDGRATQLRCTAVTVIPGLDAAGATAGAGKEQKTLDRSLERLEAEVAGRPRGLIGRFRDTGLAPAAF
ncbi:MAG: hypothetical protein JWM31_3531 [Solirubrobacterales bacterium]|nr:hypothetical protein [Solirubrobacterales bacterium]